METGQLIIYIIGAAGFTTVGALIYRIVFHVDSEKHRKEIQDLKEKQIIDRLDYVEKELSDVKKKSSVNQDEMIRKYEEVSQKGVGYEKEITLLNNNINHILTNFDKMDKKLDTIISFNKTSKIT